MSIAGAAAAKVLLMSTFVIRTFLQPQPSEATTSVMSCLLNPQRAAAHDMDGHMGASNGAPWAHHTAPVAEDGQGDEWVTCYDDHYGCYYRYNQATQESQWLPKDPHDPPQQHHSWPEYSWGEQGNSGEEQWHSGEEQRVSMDAQESDR